MHTALYEKSPNSARVDMPKDLQIILLDVSYLTLLMQRLGLQTTYSIPTVSPLFYLVLTLDF